MSTRLFRIGWNSTAISPLAIKENDPSLDSLERPSFELDHRCRMCRIPNVNCFYRAAVGTWRSAKSKPAPLPNISNCGCYRLLISGSLTSDRFPTTRLYSRRSLAPESYAFGERRALGCIVGGNHAVAGRQVPPSAVVVRRHAMACLKVVLERLELTTAFKADNVIRRNRLLDRDCRLLLFRCGFGGRPRY